MGSTVKASNGGNVNGNGQNKGKPYALMLLLAFGAAFLAIMVLHKFREKRVIAMVAAEKDEQLMALHSLLQTQQIHHEKAKKKILQIKERHRLERKEMQSTISALKEEREKLYMDLEEKNSEIKTLRERDANSKIESSETAALKEILTQREAEIQDLKNQLETPLQSEGTDDPSNPTTTLTATESSEQNIDAHQSTEHEQSENLTERSQNKYEEGHLSTNGEAVALEAVHLVQKPDATEESYTPAGINQVGLEGSVYLKERNMDENQGKNNDESHRKTDPATTQETLTETQKTSNGAWNAPALVGQQEGQGSENEQRGSSNSERVDSVGKTSHSRRHRRHRIKRLRDYLKSRRMGGHDRTKTREHEDAGNRIPLDNTVESQQNITAESALQKINVAQENGEIPENKDVTKAQDTQLPVSNMQSKETENQSGESLEETQKSKGTEKQSSESLAEKAHETDTFENITSSIKLQEIQKPDEVTDQTNTVGTEQKENASTEKQAVANPEKENTDVATSNTDNQGNTTDEIKQTKEQEQEGSLAKATGSDTDSKENNSIEQVTDKEEPEDDEDEDTDSSDIDAAHDNPSIDSKSKQTELKEQEEVGEDEETEF